MTDTVVSFDDVSTRPPARTPITVKLDADDVAWLKRAALTRGVDMSAALRRLITAQRLAEEARDRKGTT